MIDICGSAYQETAAALYKTTPALKEFNAMPAGGSKGRGSSGAK